eukprot:2951219-Pyramimonas_sp.AAC.1
MEGSGRRGRQGGPQGGLAANGWLREGLVFFFLPHRTNPMRLCSYLNGGCPPGGERRRVRQ